MTTKYLGDGIWARRTNLDASDIMMPVDVQNHHQELIQTHNAVSIGANGTSPSSYTEVRGFDKIGVNVSMSSGTGMAVYVDFSYDGVNYISTITAYDGTANNVAIEVPVTAPFARVNVKNKDTANAKTTTCYMYLKA